jgi:hypothetical protein
MFDHGFCGFWPRGEGEGTDNLLRVFLRLCGNRVRKWKFPSLDYLIEKRRDFPDPDQSNFQSIYPKKQSQKITI